MIGQMTRFATIILFSAVVSACAPTVSQVKTAAEPVNEIQNIRVTKGPEKTDVVVEGQQPMIYTTFRLTNPDRLIVDIAGIGLGKFRERLTVEEGPVQSILPKAGEGNQVSRLEIELKEPSEANVRTEGTNLLVEVVKSANADPKGKPQEALQSGAPNEEAKGVLPLPVKEEMTLPPAKSVKSIRFDRKDGLQLVLTADGQLSPQVFYLDKNRLVIDLPSVKLATKVKSIPAKDPAVKQVRIGQHSDKIRLVVDLLAPVVYSAQQLNNELRFTLQEASKASKVENGAVSASSPESPAPAPVGTPPVAEAAPNLGWSLPSSNEPVSAPLEEVEKPESASSDSKMGGTASESPQNAVAEKTNIVVGNSDAPPSPKYVGRKISLDFQDADIANVIRLIADVSGLNIVMGEDVKGKVTLKLVSVPWDQALEIILKMNNLGQIREGNIIRVATLTNIAKQQDEEAKAKETKLQAEDLITRVVYVNYGKARDLATPLK